MWYHDTASLSCTLVSASKALTFPTMNTIHPEPLVQIHLRGAVLRLVLNRPRARNALSVGLMAALQNALDEAAANNQARVIVLAANGPVFSSGHDLKEMTERRQAPDRGAAAFAALFAQCAQLMQTIVRHPKPVIAEVQGTATAAGCQLVASCDLAIASSSAHFATPGVNIGLFCSTPMVALSRNVVAQARDGDAAHRRDGVGRRGPPHRASSTAWRPEAALEGKTMELAQLIAAKPRGHRAEDRQGGVLPPDSKWAWPRPTTMQSRVMTENMLAAEAKEGIGAFVEKRDPKWPV